MKMKELSFISIVTWNLLALQCRAEWKLFKYEIMSNTTLADEIKSGLSLMSKFYTLGTCRYSSSFGHNLFPDSSYRSQMSCLAECNEKAKCSAVVIKRCVHSDYTVDVAL